MGANYGRDDLMSEYSNNSMNSMNCLNTRINYLKKNLGLICLFFVIFTIILFIYYYSNLFDTPHVVPVVINTWAFTDATAKSNSFQIHKEIMIKMFVYYARDYLCYI